MTMYGNDGYGRGGGLPLGRIAIVAVLLIGAAVTYFGSYTKNKVTGEYQPTALNPRQEIALGLQSAPQMASEMGGEVSARTDPRAARVSDVGQQLVRRSRAGQSDYAQYFNFHLLADPKTVNAFALPGGQIFITSALYDALDNDAQLAGVLGHEIGHVIHRHSSEQMAKSQFGQKLVGAASVGSDYNIAATYAAQFANQMLNLKYGRGDELEADEWGLQTMEAAGYDPSQMLSVMETLKRASGGKGRGPDIFATHPDPDARIAKIRAYLNQKYPNGVPQNLTGGQPLR